MEIRRALKPRRDLFAVLGLFVLVIFPVATSDSHDFPTLHTILDTCAFLLSGVLAFLLWDMGQRTGQLLARLKAVCFAVVALVELLHVLTALEVSADATIVRHFDAIVRPGTWPPGAYLLPLGLFCALQLSRRNVSVVLFAAGALLAGIALTLAFQILPRYTAPGFLGITRPALILAPLLWIPVISGHWRIRESDRLALVFTLFAAVGLVAPLLMLYSSAPADKVAMTAHFARVASELFLLLSLIQMGTLDTAKRMRAERELTAGNEALEARVGERTAELRAANAELLLEMDIRQVAERRTVTQLEQLDLLQRITRAIGERQDLDSIFQVVVRSVEDHMPVDFAALLNYEHHGRKLTVGRVGVRSAQLALDMAMTERARIEIDKNGLSRCVTGQLVYEPDIAAIKFPFPQRLAGAGLGSLVIVPLMVEQRSGVFGVLAVARHASNAFSSSDCEFLRMLCDHVSLAANQADLHAALKRAYDDLHLSQNAVMQQERLRALGQMASGIAHDINNAISPVSLYVEMLLTQENGFSERVRSQLETIQRAIDDVAHTVARMGEFYRERQPQLDLASIEVNRIFRQVLDLTRARWSDMAQQRGVVIETKIEGSGENPIVMGIESELREAMTNLVFNSIDAMPDGGTLTLRSGHALEAGKGIGRRVYIEVSDTGLGMDEATRLRCLEPFFTTKGDRGSGLGLAMVYGIAQRHGADVDISSAPNVGTTFRLTFPLISPSAQSSGSVRTHKIPRHTRILLIDDDPVLLTSLRDALVHEGHQVQTANGGKAGIEAFLDAHRAGNAFPVVITDLGMPHVDGRTVAAALKAAAPATSIIMLTGWGQRMVATGDVPAHVLAVLSKPPNLSDLRQLLAECSGERTEDDES
jgi:signal transduction histidine kinase/ActR/RegA family two-component response regulator